MIHVVDAMMGAGKSSAAIQYMNDHAQDKSFLYITPYLEETERIRDACPTLDFVLPCAGEATGEYTKSQHLKDLLRDGRNISVSHALFTSCDREAVRLISQGNYVVIIDEVLDVLQQHAASRFDIQMLIDCGWILPGGSLENDEYDYYEWNLDKEYTHGVFAKLARVARAHRLTNTRVQSKINPHKMSFYYWSLHEELFTMPVETYVLTYLFDGSPMKAYFDMCGFEYDMIGVGRDEEGAYRFMDHTTLPPIAGELKNKIHIFENEKLNDIGKRDKALSVNWFKNSRYAEKGENLARIRKNLIQYFKYHAPQEFGSSSRMWTTFEDYYSCTKDLGYTKGYVSVNSRATNKYRDRRVLAYCANLYANPAMTIYFRQNGVEFDEDAYALSSLVQWIFRSAIRDGEDIWIYIPSARMRELLTNWLDKLYAASQEPQKGGDAA